MKKLFYTISILMIGLGLNAQVFIDDFNYGSTSGSLTTVSGTNWVAHSGAATNPVGYSNTGLTVVGYTSSTFAGGSATFLNGSGTREDVNIAISPAITAGAAYATFVLRVTASGGTTGDYNFHFLDGAGASPGTNFRSRLYIKDGSTAGTFNVGIAKASSAGNATFAATDYLLNQDYIVVLKYAIVTGTNNDQCSLFVLSGSIPVSEPAPTVSVTNLTDSALSDLSQVASFAIRQGSTGVSAGTIDGLRVTTSWSNAQLPVTWKSFSASKTTDATLLKWSTASESNNSGFEVQRSVEGKSFEAIGFVKGAGNSAKVLNYSFADMANLSAKTVYYRLKQVDFDGKINYSKTLSVVNNEQKMALGASLPNPFNNELTVNINAIGNTTATVTLMDMIGKVHHSSIETLTAGSNSINLLTTDMPNGIYFIRVTANGETFTQKVIKK
jgi:hypothetical protein